MRVSVAWLKEWVDCEQSAAALAHRLTMAGLEVGAIEPAAPWFEQVVIAEVLATEPHANADKLKVCQVDAGFAAPLQIVCGASNVRAGLRAPLALVGAVLPGGLVIGESAKRGASSYGMLCSAKELGLAEQSDGLLELPADAPVGVPLYDYLGLADQVLEVDLTPNRADCLSMLGIAREAAALSGAVLRLPETSPVAALHDRQLAVRISAPEGCPRYLGRLITGIDNRATTPLWLQERLRRAGLRSLGPVVDVTNYVLLELGQPLHAFDAARLDGMVQVRWARDGETLGLLNGQTITLANDVLVIADALQPLALAGIMGGESSAVNESTAEVFLECAFFAPLSIMGRARRYGLHTDSSQRFERGVDPKLQYAALERATRLIMAIAGGMAGPLVDVTAPERLPVPPLIRLDAQHIERALGVALPAAEVENILLRLGMEVQGDALGWQVRAPSFRFDIAIAADLIEELARIFGYEQLPRRAPQFDGHLGLAPESVLPVERLNDLLVDRGYQEAITYSFVDESVVRALTPDVEPLVLKNPLSVELACMRTSLWCGLLSAAQWNLHRQQSRVRLYETGLKFYRTTEGIQQTPMLAGLVLGPVWDEQWGATTREADFYDAKGDVEALLAATGQLELARFVAAEHPALHPGQSAKILDGMGSTLGWLGMLHPQLEVRWALGRPAYLFELELAALRARPVPRFTALSRFPSVRRDLAIVVADTVSAQAVLDAIAGAAVPVLGLSGVFDCYQGVGVADGRKSLAVALTFQHSDATLTDADVDAAVATILDRLHQECGAQLRS